MLTCQIPRGFEIADEFRKQGIPVLLGGIASSLHAEEAVLHSDAVFIGETEGRIGEVLDDLRRGELKKIYNYLSEPAPIEIIGTARRDILKRDLYSYRGVQMADLIHASRGCRFSCYPCCVSFLGGRSFRPRPIDKVIEEVESIPNNRLFFVDNSLAQDKTWELDLFKALAPLKRSIICHPLEDDEEVLRAARDAGVWWIYQAIFDTSPLIRDRVTRLKKYGFSVEGTILLGLDNHDESAIRELIDFLLEIEVDLAEFTVLTPFPHTRAYDDLAAKNRILHRDWRRYTGGEVVFQPAQMSPHRLQDLYYRAWDTFYADEPQQLKMARLLKKVIAKERKDETTGRFREIGLHSRAANGKM